MTDIVERLRLLNELFIGAEPSQTAPLCNGTAQEMINLAQEAADEIEQMRKLLTTDAVEKRGCAFCGGNHPTSCCAQSGQGG